MPRYFVSGKDVKDGAVEIGGATARHIAVSRRGQPGDALEVADEAGHAYEIELTRVSPDAVTGRIVKSHPAGGEPKLKVTLLQAIVKDGMDEAIDAAVELGVARIVPVVTERTVVRLDAGRAAARLRHWQEVARSAAEVSYRGVVPPVDGAIPLDRALKDLPSPTRLLACAMTASSTPLVSLALSAAEPLALVVGPEGGLSPSDLDAIAASRGELVHLGPRVLRGRIAGSHALALCMVGAGELDGAAGQDRMH
jgi:16S rRNA (uracil1498-N3)-methyltransferase